MRAVAGRKTLLAAVAAALATVAVMIVALNLSMGNKQVDTRLVHR